ncbi:6-N-hydroxylaminopurine resistance protein [Salmonella enterica subsp. enterica]|uniref:6-N-hydroxylaminopurine resistance protein n=1 Tax=Salmonella enterica I TaxID=59201 RepID=A0A447N0Q5_SALET|nr:6-N-hydroxylaminopurine resistance protein [Salmonella enterica subsp. enterica]
MALLMQNSGKTGWLYRVIAPGKVLQRCAAGTGVASERLSRFMKRVLSPGLCRLMTNNITGWLSAAGLSASWSRTMQKRRLSGKIEDSARRLWGDKNSAK